MLHKELLAGRSRMDIGSPTLSGCAALALWNEADRPGFPEETPGEPLSSLPKPKRRLSRRRQRLALYRVHSWSTRGNDHKLKLGRFQPEVRKTKKTKKLWGQFQECWNRLPRRAVKSMFCGSAGLSWTKLWALASSTSLVFEQGFGPMTCLGPVQSE